MMNNFFTAEWKEAAQQESRHFLLLLQLRVS